MIYKYKQLLFSSLFLVVGLIIGLKINYDKKQEQGDKVLNKSIITYNTSNKEVQTKIEDRIIKYIKTGIGTDERILFGDVIRSNIEGLDIDYIMEGTGGTWGGFEGMVVQEIIRRSELNRDYITGALLFNEYMEGSQEATASLDLALDNLYKKGAWINLMYLISKLEESNGYDVARLYLAGKRNYKGWKNIMIELKKIGWDNLSDEMEIEKRLMNSVLWNERPGMQEWELDLSRAIFSIRRGKLNIEDLYTLIKKYN